MIKGNPLYTIVCTKCDTGGKNLSWAVSAPKVFINVQISRNQKLSQVAENFDTIHGLGNLALATSEVTKDLTFTLERLESLCLLFGGLSMVVPGWISHVEY